MFPELGVSFTPVYTCVQLYPTLCDPTNCKPTKLLYPWGYPSRNTGVGSHSLLQGIFPTQGLNPCLRCGFCTSEPSGKPSIQLPAAFVSLPLRLCGGDQEAVLQTAV